MKCPTRCFYLVSILFVLFFFVGIHSYGINPYAFQRYTVEDGLPENNIRALAQDSLGFLWIGTTHGLCRFDGVRFKSYLFNPIDTHSIADNYIYTLYIDRSNTLWALMPQYVCRYDPTLDRFDRIMLGNEKKNTQPSVGGGITQDSKGNIWVATPNTGLFKVDARKNEAHRISLKEGFTCAQMDSSDVLWLGLTGAIARYDTHTGNFNEYYNSELDANLYGAVTIDGNKGYVLFNNRLFTFHPSDTANTLLIPSETRIKEFEEVYINCYSLYDHQKSIIYGTNGKGLYVFDREAKTTHTVRNIPEINSSLSNDLIRQLLVDRNQVLWVATQDGLNRYIAKEENIRSYNNLNDAKHGLLFSNINCFAEDSMRTIWIGSRDGLSRFSPSSETFVNITSLKTSQGEHKLDRVRDLSCDSKGNIWIGTRQGIYTAQRETGLFSYYTANHDRLVGDEILCTYIDCNDVLWTGTFGFGIDYLCLYEDSLKYRHIKADGSGLSSDYIKDIIKLKRGLFCFGTLNKGFDLYNSSTGEFVNVRMDRYTQNYESNAVNQLFEDSQEQLWVATWSGLFVFDKKGELIRLFTTDEGMPSNEFSSVMEDERGGIWASSSNGLTRIIEQSGQFHTIHYSTHDGLSTNFFMSGSNFCASDGTFYYGGVNGFDCFNPAKMQIDTLSQSPVLTDLLLFNKPITVNEQVDGRILLPASLQNLSTVEMTHGQNSLTIRFATPVFNYRRGITYEYSLEGRGYNRVEATTQLGEAVFHNLPPGEYIFQVSSYNANRFLSQPSQLLITILPPWWKRWYAISVYILLFLLILFLVFRFVLHEQNLRHRVEIETLEREKISHLNEIKIRVYTNITHEIRTPLTLILAPLERILKDSTLSDSVQRQLLMVQKNASYLLSLVNQLLDFRKVESEHVTLHARRLDFSAFTMQIVESFRPYAERKGLTITGRANQEPLPFCFDPELMEKVIYNLLSNAIKFTRQGSVEVLLARNTFDKQITLTVTDTGIGIDSENQQRIFDDFYQAHSSDGSAYSYGTGIGLALTKRYVELHRGSIRVESISGNGSRFELLFPDTSMEGIDLSQEAEQPPPLCSTIVPLMEMEPAEGPGVVFDRKNELTVLVVDDHPDIRQFIASSLDCSYTIITADNGISALKMTKEHLPDMVISDIMMPQMDGYQLCGALKNNLLTCHIPVLFLSSKTSHDAQLEGLLTGANDYITKPFNEELLRAKVSSILKNRMALEEHFKAEFCRFASSETESSKTEIEVYEDPFLKEVIAFVESRMDDPDLNGQSVEEHFKINKMQLYRKLKAVTGSSVTDIIRDIRIRKACQLLASSYMNVSEISFAVGFSDPYYFSKTFKKVTGLSPVLYRKQYIRTHSDDEKSV